MGRQLKSRHGFTMVELLVVITLIVLMVSLLFGASYRFVGSAREAATATTVSKAGGIIQERVRAFREFDFSDSAVLMRDSWNVKNPSDKIMTSDLADVLIRKVRYKHAFPQAIAEMDSTQLVQFFGTSTVPTYDPRYESGIVLYAVVMKGETFGAPAPADDAFSASELKIDSDTGGLPCLVDGWGEPLRFYRWPTRLIRCGELDFNGDGAYDDYNKNGSQDPAGWTDTSTSSTLSPAIRPSLVSRAPTPASLLMANLAPFNSDPPVDSVTPDPTLSIYACGPDGAKGTSGASAPWNTLGFPDTDDPEPLNVDPDDPTGQLVAWFFDAQVSAATATNRRTNFVVGSGDHSNAFHDFFTFHTPLIVSSGPDRQLGLFEPTDIPTSTNSTSVAYGYLAAPNFSSGAIGSALVQPLFDNITNLNQRAGGN